MKILSAVAASAIFVAAPAFASDQIVSAAATSVRSEIAWRKDNDVEAAFMQAKASNKPLFLYWGAAWCPPCNQVKVTIFNRQDFIDKSRHFVPVYLDGDSPGAQKLGARFKVRGYPTMILFKPDGSEITRLPGEVDSARYVQVLSMAMNASLSVQDTVKLALAGSKKLSAEDWSLLADYSWDDPGQKLLGELAPGLLRLSALSPFAPSATRLYLKALQASATAKPGQVVPTIDKKEAIAKLQKVLSDAGIVRANMDVLTGTAAELLSFLTLPKSESRHRFAHVWHLALARLADDSTLSKTDRLAAISGQISIYTIDHAKPDAGFQKDVQQRVNLIERATTDAYERQSVLNAAAHALADADMLDASDALLKAELKRSHSPYYFMSTLGANAKKRGDKSAAVNWYEQAYHAAKGPATRLQWGANYVNALIELSPADGNRIEKAAATVLTEVGATENAFYERNLVSLERMGRKLDDWNKDLKHQASVQKLRLQLDEVCKKLPDNDGQRGACQGLLAKS
jgi:thioredoxin-related protein